MDIPICLRILTEISARSGLEVMSQSSYWSCILPSGRVLLGLSYTCDGLVGLSFVPCLPFKNGIQNYQMEKFAISSNFLVHLIPALYSCHTLTKTVSEVFLPLYPTGFLSVSVFTLLLAEEERQKYR